MGLGNQVGSTTDHLKLLSTQHVKISKYEQSRTDRSSCEQGNEDPHLDLPIVEDVPFVADLSQELVHALLLLALAGVQGLHDVHEILRGAVTRQLQGLKGCFEEAVGHLVPE